MQKKIDDIVDAISDSPYQYGIPLFISFVVALVILSIYDPYASSIVFGTLLVAAFILTSAVFKVLLGLYYRRQQQ